VVYPRERKANTIVTWTEKRTWATRDRVWNGCVVDVRYGLLKQGFCVPSTKAAKGMLSRVSRINMRGIVSGNKYANTLTKTTKNYELNTKG